MSPTAMAAASEAFSSFSSHVKSSHVFPSFHGPDVGKGILSHLRRLFAKKRIKMFKKDQEIERGHTIEPELVQAIRESRVSIVLLSKNYASSRWCLDELVEILKCKEEQKQIVLPIFYDVDPHHVRRQRGDFGKALEKTCEDETEEQKRRWIEALTSVGNIEGEHFRNWSDEAAMVEKLSRDVSDNLKVEELKEAFRGCDVDHNGFISAAELRYAMTRDGGKVTDEEVEEIIRKADDDGNGRISYDEFLKLDKRMADEEAAMVVKFATDVTMSVEKKKEMMEAFMELDVDQNGFITTQEYQRVMKNRGKIMTCYRACKFMRKADLDGNGQINFDEFVKLMMARPTTDKASSMVEKFAPYVANKLNEFISVHGHGKCFHLKKNEEQFLMSFYT